MDTTEYGLMEKVAEKLGIGFVADVLPHNGLQIGRYNTVKVLENNIAQMFADIGFLKHASSDCKVGFYVFWNLRFQFLRALTFRARFTGPAARRCRHEYNPL
jgi:hypothetical protein